MTLEKLGVWAATDRLAALRALGLGRLVELGLRARRAHQIDRLPVGFDRVVARAHIGIEHQVGSYLRGDPAVLRQTRGVAPA